MAPEKFIQVWKDFKADLLLTFPELSEKLTVEDDKLYDYCVELYPKLFFELLYENATLFDEPRLLLPEIDFSLLMKDEKVTDKTKKTIWKYLQLLLFSVMENIESKETIGDTSKLFEAIHQEDLHKKISETMEEMKGLFDFSDASGIPEHFDTENLKSHLDGLMDGKIGALAKEIAGEATSELEGIEDKEEFMKTLMKNPTKILDLVKNIGTKLETKIKKGDLKESELLEEASQIMEKMQDIPGMKEMMGKMGMGGKVDFKAMSNKIQENLRKSKMKDRLNKKREERAAEKDEKVNITQKSENTFVVKVDDSVPEKSTAPNSNSNPKKKKKKGKV